MRNMGGKKKKEREKRKEKRREKGRWGLEQRKGKQSLGGCSF